MSFSTPIRRHENCGGNNIFLAASVAGARTGQSEVLRQLHGLVGSARVPDTDLEGGHSGRRVLSPRLHNTAFTTIGNLLVVRHSR
ncbi:hypothetical protein TIFTF001_052879 [Ficus carica]|uniref:Uncharacterized protein n=1 Tax=Ficus carica TaxID=3494 RepID=A0AA88JG19_FICCA|nr:hypothetical protein TIFTF001_052879 [Ficus carica]